MQFAAQLLQSPLAAAVQPAPLSHVRLVWIIDPVASSLSVLVAGIELEQGGVQLGHIITQLPALLAVLRQTLFGVSQHRLHAAHALLPTALVLALFADAEVLY